jgi:diguanylate cyclase (GGDEF)-like protein
MSDQPDSPPQAAQVPLSMVGEILPALLAARGEAWALKDLATGRYVQASPAWLAWLGQGAEAVLGHTDADIFEAPLAGAFRAAELTAQAQDGPLCSEHRFDWGGQRRAFNVWRVVTPPAERGTRWLFGVWSDLSETHRQEAQLRAALDQIEQHQRANEALRRELADQALRDPASGLYSRAHFEDQLRREVDLSTREHREFALVLMAIDPASEKVSALGPTGQTRVLEAMGNLLRSGTRAMDASCRLDEGRFAVLLSGVGLATAHSRMEGLRRKCATQIVMHGGQELGFTVAMGVASFPHTAHSQDELVAACEAALAEAQRRGGNHVTLAAIRFESTR